MQSTDLYLQILGLRCPWSVSSVDMDEGKEEIHIHVDHSLKSQFRCSKGQLDLPICDHVPERTWRHQVDLPWSDPKSGFTAMFERLAIDMIRFMSKTRATVILRVILACLICIRDRAVARGLARRDADKATGTHRVLRHGCVGEKSWRKRREFGTIICDVVAKTVEEVYEALAGNGLSTFYKELGVEG